MVPDTKPPLQVSTATITVGYTYTDAGATCKDNVDSPSTTQAAPLTQAGIRVDLLRCGRQCGNTGDKTVNVKALPPTFVSSELDPATMVLTITFSETIDVTPKTNVNATKIHIRESGNYTGGGITLTAVELGTTADASTISFTLTEPLKTVKGLTTPELTIEPGAVQGIFGNLIVGTFDVSTAAFAHSFVVTSQGTPSTSILPQGMAFSNDGTKMFIVGWNEEDTTEDIAEYTLSTPFDVSSASYDGDAERFSVGGQEGTPQGMAFSNDGAKMFVIGSSTGNNINEYTLSTPFDVSTASYNGDTERFSVSAREERSQAWRFQTTAPRCSIGNAGDDINESPCPPPLMSPLPPIMVILKDSRFGTGNITTKHGVFKRRRQDVRNR